MKSVRRLLDRVTLYLPLLVLVLMAMGSWWLVRSIPALLGSPPAPVRKDPDYRLARFTAYSFDADGRLVRQVTGERAQHYPEHDELHIDQLHFESLSANGARLDGRARKGVASDKDKRLTLTGQVVVAHHPATGQATTLLEGERLVALQKEEKLVSADPVRMRRDNDVVTAGAMALDMKQGQYQLSGRVQGQLLPKRP